MTNLEYALRFAKYKIQEMIYTGRKTDQCGVILFGTEETDNIVNSKDGGYEHVTEFIPIGTPNADTLAQLDTIQATQEHGDPIDAIVVGVEVQDKYLGNKKTWTRRAVLLTDGESPIEIDKWEDTVQKMNNLKVHLSVIGVDFDDEENDFVEENKSRIKVSYSLSNPTKPPRTLSLPPQTKLHQRENEAFYHELVEALDSGIVGNCNFAMDEIMRPDIREVKTNGTPTELRIGDTKNAPTESVTITVRTGKCTAVARPRSWKKFVGVRVKDKKKKGDGEDVEVMSEGEDEDEDDVVEYRSLKQRTKYYIEKEEDEDGEEEDGDPDVKQEDEDTEMKDASKPSGDDSATEDEDCPSGPTTTASHPSKPTRKSSKDLPSIDKEDLIRGYKYGSTFIPVSEPFLRLPTSKGIEINAFFKKKDFRRELEMSEVYYIWAEPKTSMSQVALSSLVRAMEDSGLVAIARWVTRDGMDPKIGILEPRVDVDADCFLWVKVPFADDVRKYHFPSLEKLYNKRGERITEHPYIPTEEQQDAMDEFVEEMDLMDAGEPDEDGNPTPWFDTRFSYNPAIHRIKQAQLHAAIVPDLHTFPLGPPHYELTKYFNPPELVVKRARKAAKRVEEVFKVKEVPRKGGMGRGRKDGHVLTVEDEEEEGLLLDKIAGPKGTQTQKKNGLGRTQTRREFMSQNQKATQRRTQKRYTKDDSATEDEDGADDEEEEELLLDKAPPSKPEHERAEHGGRLPTPSQTQRSTSPPPLPPSPSSPHSPTSTIRPPGRIIGLSYPLLDFQKNIKQGDLVSKAVEDLAWAVKEIVKKPFAGRREDEMVSCLRALRKVCLEEDEVDAWNNFLHALKRICLTEKPGNTDFWSRISREGRELSLISTREAEEQGGSSSVSEAEAQKFVQA
ncbi:SPOC domain-like protein [Panus rudis PR-1116 ss-1]|nr:SPOC domain-like protein [Panus rudis PR-1116 ss-1]